MYQNPPWLEPRTAYIHIPFCAHHCGYCDFAVSVGNPKLIPLYLEALELEFQALGTPRYVDSLFIGGGTPTFLPIPQLERLLTLIQHWFPWHPESRRREYSIESTPDSLDTDRCQLLASFGVNRVSVGVQSFQPQTLKALDRKHVVDQIGVSIDNVRRSIPSYSLDLIFAAPGSTLADWKSDLAQAIEYAPDHISTYGLTYETGTPLARKRSLGRIDNVVEEDLELQMYEASMEILTQAGFEHYEISNFAKPGHRCEHNERYWANEAYYGLGVGAAKYVNGCREVNFRNTPEYVRRLFAGESVIQSSEELHPRERAVETLAVQLRRCDGIDGDSFKNQTGFDLTELLGDSCQFLQNLGLLEKLEKTWRLSRKGRPVADGVIEFLMSRIKT